ncbi:hypothetical protein [Azorhizophilus paspali]|uniref:hypothetical protein n=1 Tax=Azorhizophilus paspali TaxID=69963 RepID=UPI0036700D41
MEASDCETIEKAGIPAIAVNSSWRMARFAEIVYAGDACWWTAYGAEIDIPAERWSCTRQAAQRFGVNHHPAHGEYNSGMRAIQFAIWQGASRILLLGYDCSLANGSHWHGDHERTKNPDAKKVAGWHRQFAQVAAEARATGVEVLNCSRETALICFPRLSLEEALCSFARCRD